MSENDFDEWWAKAENTDRINFLFKRAWARVVDRNHDLLRGPLLPIINTEKKKKYIRVTSDEGVGFFRQDYHKLISDFFQPKSWLLTEKRSNAQKQNFRILVGVLDNGRFVLLAPILNDERVEELFAE